MQTHVKSHVMSEKVVKKTSSVENLKNLFPLSNLLLVVASTKLHVVQLVVLSPVWPRFKLLDKCIFHTLLKLVNTVRSGEEWYLNKSVELKLISG